MTVNIEKFEGTVFAVTNEHGEFLSAWDWLHQCTVHVWSREKRGNFASKSEKKRWLLNKAVHVNGEPLIFNELMDFPIEIWSIVLFPKSPDKITLF